MNGANRATHLEDDWPAERASAAGLRVALFSGNYNYTLDGANKALNRLAAYLAERGAAVRVYSPTSRTPAFEPIGDLVSVPSLAIPRRPEYRVALGLPLVTKRDVYAFQPNIIHVSVPDWLGAGAQRLGRELGVPIVASMHTRFETYFSYYGLAALRSWAWNRQAKFYQASDLVLVPNEACKQHLGTMGVGPGRVSIWGRGVDAEIFNPARADVAWRQSQGYRDTDTILLFLGRLVREKGIEQFAAVVEELRRRGQTLRPLVIGEGPAMSEFKRMLKGALFVGRLEGAYLGRAIASADILLNPSTTEAFGNVNLEALAAGLAVVSADVDSARALITDRYNGRLCPPRVNSLADAVEELISEPRTAAQLRKAAPGAALNRDWPSVLDAVVDSYRRAQEAKTAY